MVLGYRANANRTAGWGNGLKGTAGALPVPCILTRIPPMEVRKYLNSQSETSSIAFLLLAAAPLPCRFGAARPCGALFYLSGTGHLGADCPAKPPYQIA